MLHMLAEILVFTFSIRPVCAKPVLCHIFDFWSIMHHLKEKHILFVMTEQLSSYLNSISIQTEFIDKDLLAFVTSL